MSVALDLEGPIAWVHLDRPGALNAIDRAMTDALERALDAVEAATDARAVILACRGLSFCAGNDVKEMAALRADEAEALVSRQGRLLTRLSALRPVTVAALDGYALGVGLHLALAADLRVSTNRARL